MVKDRRKIRRRGGGGNGSERAPWGEGGGEEFVPREESRMSPKGGGDLVKRQRRAQPIPQRLGITVVGNARLTPAAAARRCWEEDAGREKQAWRKGPYELAAG